MATQPTIIRTHAHRSMLVLAGFAIVVVMMVIGWLFLRPIEPTATNQPAPAVIPAPGGVAVQQDISAANRIFADEIAGASAQDLRSAASGMQPEWITVVEQATANVIKAAQSAFSDNRIFADEMNAGAGSMDWNAPQPDAPIIEPNGNR